MNRPKAKSRKRELLYIIGCEGKNQETLYFEKVRRLFNEIETRQYDIVFDYAEPFGGDPRCVVERTVHKSIGKENKAAVFDYDGKREKYEEAIDLAHRNHVELGYSNYCFDLWLVWNKMDYHDAVDNQSDYASLIRSAYRLSFNANIKKIATVEKIVSQITTENIFSAIKRAERVIGKKKAGAKIFTPQGWHYYENPDTQLHNLLLNIINKMGIKEMPQR